MSKGIWHWKMREADYERWKKINCGRNRTDKSKKKKKRRLRTLAEKENYKYLGIVEADTIKQEEMKGKIRIDKIQTNKKTSGNQTLQQKWNQRNKHLGCHAWKVQGNIVKMDKGGTQTNGLEDQNTEDDVQGFAREIWHRQTNCVKGKKERLNLLALGIALMYQYQKSKTTLKRTKKDQLQLPVTTLKT